MIAYFFSSHILSTFPEAENHSMSFFRVNSSLYKVRVLNTGRELVSTFWAQATQLDVQLVICLTEFLKVAQRLLFWKNYLFCFRSPMSVFYLDYARDALTLNIGLQVCYFPDFGLSYNICNIPMTNILLLILPWVPSLSLSLSLSLFLLKKQLTMKDKILKKFRDIYFQSTVEFLVHI